MNNAYVNKYVKKQCLFVCFKNMFRSEVIKKEKNLKGIRPRHGKTSLFPPLLNIPFEFVVEELTLTVPQFPTL